MAFVAYAIACFCESKGVNNLTKIANYYLACTNLLETREVREKSFPQELYQKHILYLLASMLANRLLAWQALVIKRMYVLFAGKLPERFFPLGGSNVCGRVLPPLKNWAEPGVK